MIVEPDFPDHWKTRMLAESLGDEAAPVYLLRLWAHCQNRRQDTFENLPPEALRALCRFPGHSNKLEASLATSGFIRRGVDGSLHVVGWSESNKSLIASWKNGCKRKKGSEDGGIHGTHGLPTGSPAITQGQPNPLLYSNSSSLNSSSKSSWERLTFGDWDKSEACAILDDWAFYVRGKGKRFSEIEAQHLVFHCQTLGWDLAKFKRNVSGCASKSWDNIRDCDEPQRPEKQLAATARRKPLAPGIHDDE